ncbi:MAG TPA: carboxymuconolactone decarboxylase family protein [Burkholderiales bacterium]|nr:carboxymuconolactone decarboxylase family protein [Burkholderiales bacterium]
MEHEIDYAAIAPDGIKAMAGLEAYVRHSGLEPSLLELVKTRVSQINRCAYCIDMHTKDARARGESEQRLYALQAWRETPFYSDRERAGLAWAEALTELSSKVIPESLQVEMARLYSEKEWVDLTFAIIAINGWNRLAIPFHKPAGSYQANTQHAS